MSQPSTRRNPLILVGILGPGGFARGARDFAWGAERSPAASGARTTQRALGYNRARDPRIALKKPGLAERAALGAGEQSVSRAFVKEDAQSEAQSELPERPQSPHPNYVTPQGLASLEHRLATLLTQRSAVSEEGDAIAYAEALRRIDRNVRYVSARIDRAIVVDPAEQPRDEVAFGASVRVLDREGEERIYTIVGEDEADAAIGKVSWVSPLANALLGAGVGDEVIWMRPSGDVELEVLAIDYASSAAVRRDCDR